jgi:ribonuclease P protein subunit POP4
LTLPIGSNILLHELIGLEIKVLEDSNPNNRYIKGTVVDESKNTLTIESDKNIKIAKEEAVFLIKLNGETVKIEGKALLGRPEDRVKRKIKRRW